MNKLKKIKKYVHFVGISFLVCIFVFLTIVLARTFLLESRQKSEVCPHRLEIPDIVVEHLSQAIRFVTISSFDKKDIEKKEFEDFHAWLRKSFPSIHAKLKQEMVNELALLYLWQGSDLELKPILLMAHQDVVIVESGTEKNWKFPAFSGSVQDGFIWGRGTLDDKGSMMAILEAVEYLLNQNYVPKRSVYLAFGFDEEFKGEKGAKEIASLLKRRNIILDNILDEGGCIAEGIIPGVSKPVALIGTAEKGYASLELVAHSPGGHSSIPPLQTCTGMLAAAIHKIDTTPFPARVDGATLQFLETMAPEMPFMERSAIANLWLLQWLLIRSFSQLPSTNATIRTTAVVTMLGGSRADNVLPQTATAVVNLRIMPGETVQSVKEHLKKIVRDTRVEILEKEHFATSDPVSPSSLESTGYKNVEKTIREIFPDIIVSPYLTIATTDSRHFKEVTNNIYRFIPAKMGSKDLERIHGTDERIGVENYKDSVRFYIQFIKNCLVTNDIEQKFCSKK